MKYKKGIVNVILLTAVVILAGLVGYFYAKDTPPAPVTPIQTEQIPTTSKSPVVSNTTTYKNIDLGITFEYPKKWGTVTKNVEKGCYYSSSKEGCDNLTFTFSANNKVSFASASNSFVKDPNPRGGSFLDTFFIKSQTDITNFCANRVGRTDTSSCEVKTNTNGIMYAKALMKMCSEGDCDQDTTLYYYMKLNSKTFSGLVFSMQPGDKEAMAVVDTVRFVSIEQKISSLSICNLNVTVKNGQATKTGGTDDQYWLNVDKNLSIGCSRQSFWDKSNITIRELIAINGSGSGERVDKNIYTVFDQTTRDSISQLYSEQPSALGDINTETIGFSKNGWLYTFDFNNREEAKTSASYIISVK